MKRILIEERIEDLHVDVRKILKILGVEENPIPAKDSGEDLGALMTVREVSAFLQMEESLIVEMCRKNEIPNVKRGRYIRVKRDELIAWMRKKDKAEEGSVEDYVNRYLEKRPLKG